jgi:hypothetical protein
MKERVTRMREHHPVEKEFVVGGCVAGACTLRAHLKERACTLRAHLKESISPAGAVGQKVTIASAPI